MSAAITAATIGTAGAVYSAKQAQKGAMASQKTSRSPWLAQASQSALSKADAISNRQYTPFTGDRVAGLSQNELQAQRLASQFGNQTRMGMTNGFQASDLNQFRNPYLESVLGNQQRVIGNEYGRQSAALAGNQSAMDAFRTGRSDLARARLDDSRMRALGDSEAQGQAGAFDNAMNNYFANQANNRANLDTATGALNITGAADRSVRQAQNDFDYNQFLEKRDWDVTNLQPLLASIQASNGAAGTLTTQSGPKSSPWGAAAGLLSTAIGQYGKYRAAQTSTKPGGSTPGWSYQGMPEYSTNTAAAPMPKVQNSSFGSPGTDYQSGSGYDPGYQQPGDNLNADTLYDTSNTGDGGALG